LGCGSDRTQNIQFGAARASRLGDQVADQIGGSGEFMAAVAVTLRETLGAAMQRRSMVGVDAGLG
jgi:hypothetical protein